jgi:hypothetical protein
LSFLPSSLTLDTTADNCHSQHAPPGLPHCLYYEFPRFSVCQLPVSFAKLSTRVRISLDQLVLT